MRRSNQTALAVAVVVAIVAMLSLSTSAATAAKKQRAARRAARPAAMGAGRMPSARASNVGNTAWIFTSDFQSSTPTQVTGSINITAAKGRTIQYDKANANAQFSWNGANYVVRVVCNFPVSGQIFPSRGPVQLLRPVFGSGDLGTLNLPQTMAQVAIYGRSTITKNGRVIADNQPTIAAVVYGIHGSDQTYLSSPDTSRNEIMLVVPGPLSGQKFVKGFPNGYFYIYWPNANLSMSGGVKPTSMAPYPPRAGRGPVAPRLGTQGPVGTIALSITNDGIGRPSSQMARGLYSVRITNNSSTPRGVVITGLDLCCSEYVRFSNLLGPNGSQTFRWYFAPGTVTIRDFLGGTRTQGGFTNVRFGGHSTTITFQ